MAMEVQEIQRWLSTLPPDSGVGVDDGGLCLVSTSDPDVYCEVGGIPEPSPEEEEE